MPRALIADAAGLSVSVAVWERVSRQQAAQTTANRPQALAESLVIHLESTPLTTGTQVRNRPLKPTTPLSYPHCHKRTPRQVAPNPPTSARTNRCSVPHVQGLFLLLSEDAQ